MAWAETAFTLLAMFLRRGVDAISAARRINGMTEAEIDAAIVDEEKRSDELMDRWNNPSEPDGS